MSKSQEMQPEYSAGEPPAVPTDELARDIERKFMVAVMEADDAFTKAGATGTKTWIREFLLDRLEANGIGIGMKEHLRATQPPCVWRSDPVIPAYEWVWVGNAFGGYSGPFYHETPKPLSDYASADCWCLVAQPPRPTATKEENHG